MRPVQITDNHPEGFWTGVYPSIRKDLASRYPNTSVVEPLSLSMFS